MLFFDLIFSFCESLDFWKFFKILLAVSFLFSIILFSKIGFPIICFVGLTISRDLTSSESEEVNKPNEVATIKEETPITLMIESILLPAINLNATTFFQKTAFFIPV